MLFGKMMTHQIQALFKSAASLRFRAVQIRQSADEREADEMGTAALPPPDRCSCQSLAAVEEKLASGCRRGRRVHRLDKPQRLRRVAQRTADHACTPTAVALPTASDAYIQGHDNGQLLKY